MRYVMLAYEFDSRNVRVINLESADMATAVEEAYIKAWLHHRGEIWTDDKTGKDVPPPTTIAKFLEELEGGGALATAAEKICNQLAEPRDNLDKAAKARFEEQQIQEGSFGYLWFNEQVMVLEVSGEKYFDRGELPEVAKPVEDKLAAMAKAIMIERRRRKYEELKAEFEMAPDFGGIITP